MSITLFSGQTAAGMEKKLEALRAQLADSEATVATAEGALEAALSDAANSDKPLSALSTAKSKVTALMTVIAKAEAAFAQARDTEARAARMKEILSIEKQARAKLDTLHALREKLLADALDLARQIDAFDAGVRELRGLSGGGVRFDTLLTPSAAGILAACAARPPQDNPQNALERADAAMRSDLESLSMSLDSTINAAKYECE
jgi:hypothetical protein